TDLVPRPRMRVVRAEHGAHNDAPRLGRRQLIPDLPVQFAPREGVDDVVLDAPGCRRERVTAMLARGRVEAGGDQTPRLRVTRKVRVAKTIELVGEQLRVDHVQHWDLRLTILRHHPIAERTERARLRLGKEPDRRRLLDALEYDPAR